MACGKPVIATKLPGIIKEFGKNNGVIYVNKPENVIDKVIELYKDREKIKEIGLKAANFVQKYSWKNITDQFEKTLEDILKNTRQR